MDPVPLLTLVFLLTLVACTFWTVEGQSVRLVSMKERTSSSVTAGRLEILSNGRWGSVCNSGFDYSEARVACRQLGFSSYINYGTVGAYGMGFEAASNSTSIWRLSCYSSSYSSLSSCNKYRAYSYSCTHEQDVVLSCLGNGALRLTGSYYYSTLSSSSSSGRLEVYYNGQWGTVCDNSFDQTDADVACRQLGYAVATNHGTVGTLGYSQGYNNIWLTSLVCASTNFMLSSCSHSGFGNTRNCHHYQDVAVSCSSTGTIRLVTKGEHTSSALTAGRLEVYHSGQWGTVCGDGFHSTAATIACRQLGFSTYLSYGTVGSNTDVSSKRFDAASESTPIWLSGLSCYSYYSVHSLTDCTHDAFGFNSCTHSEDVTLQCKGDGALRLSGSYSSSYTATSGRLEVYYSGGWGTVCDDSFDQTDADVACRQLGFNYASNYGTVGSSEYSSYSGGSGTIWLDELGCTSSDLMLSLCSHKGSGNSYCSHSEDVAVSCAISNPIRLVTKREHTSSNLTAGRLEVYHNRQWGTVCNNGFSYNEATVACRQLGFSSYIDYYTVGSYSSYSSRRFDAAPSFTPIWLSDLSCSGSEYSLFQCSHAYFGNSYCTHSEDVSLFCLGNGALRLGSYSYSSSSSGRLEVYYNGQWGTVCDNSFDQTDADVACRQLGFESASRYGNVYSLGFDQGYGTIWLNDLQCTSSDLMLLTCSHSGFGNSYCSHSEDVAVDCTYSTPTTGSSTSITNLSFGAISGIVVAVIIVFVVLVVFTVSCAIRARVRGSRLQNLHRGTAAANSNFPATILSSNSASSNFAYAPIPQEPPPPYPGSPTSTDGGSNNNNNDFSNFVAPQLTQPQPQAQQAPVSSHEYPIQDQQAPYDTYSYTPFYPEQPAATESEGITSDTTPLLHQESDDNDDSNLNVNAVGPQDHLEAQLPDVTVTVDLSAPETVPGAVPPSNSDSEVPPFPPPPSDPAKVTDNMHPPKAAGQVESRPTVADGDSDRNPQLLPPSN